MIEHRNKPVLTYTRNPECMKINSAQSFPKSHPVTLDKKKSKLLFISTICRLGKLLFENQWSSYIAGIFL